MRLCISGAQCTGKTTLMNLIENSGEFSDYTFFYEIVRKLASEENIRINDDSHHHSQMRIFEEHYKNIEKSSNFISDRCALDALVYSKWGFLHDKFTTTEHIEHLIAFDKCIKHYDVIFYLPIEFDVVDDGFRSLNTQFRNEIDELFVALAARHGVHLVKLSGSPQEKFETFCKTIKTRKDFIESFCNTNR